MNQENFEARKLQAISSFSKVLQADTESGCFPVGFSSFDAESELRSIDISPPNMIQIELLCSQHELSPLAVLRTVLALVLRYFSGQNSIVFGLTSSSPTQVCRIELDDKKTVVEVLRQLQNHVDETLSLKSILSAGHQALPNSSSAVQFDIAMLLDQPSLQGLNREISTSQVIDQDELNRHLFIAKIVDERDDMKIKLEYTASALSESLAACIACVFHKALAFVLAKPLQPIGNLILSNDAKLVVEPFTLLGERAVVQATFHEVQTQVASVASILDMYPCTPLQEGLMALSMKQSGDFVKRAIFTLPTGLNLENFRAAWQATINSNAILRTRIFQTESSGLVQAVFERQKIDWLTASNLEDYVRADKEKSIGLGSALARYAIINEPTSGVTHFVWTLHHAIMDAWSIRLLLEQVDQAYRGARVSQLLEFNQYISYLLHVDHRSVEDFWRSRLAGTCAVPFPKYPSEDYVPRAYNSLKHHIRMPEIIKTEVTKSTVIQAAWTLLIGKHTNMNDVVFGVVLAGRNVAIPNIKSINGPTLTTVPMRIGIDFTQSVAEYLTSIQKQRSELKPFQHAGLQNIRRLSGAAQKACSFHNLLVIQSTLGKNPESLFNETTNTGYDRLTINAYGLLLECEITHDGLTAKARFDVRVVSEKHMQIILEQFESLVTELSSTTSASIGDIQIHGLGEKSTSQMGNPDTEEVNSCVHELIEKSMVEHPQASAICSWDGEMTYDQLRITSQRLAHRLKACSIGPEVTVALLFEKSLWVVVAMLGVMKAGGVFVPLDPAHPKQRLESLIQEIGAGLLLCSEKYHDYFTGISDKTIIVDKPTMESWPAFDGPACKSITPKNAVYILFTSGSTGKPKGCVLEHRACCSSMIMLARALGMNSASRVLQFSSYTFDACILEILITLTVGGCVCIPSQEQRLNNIVVTMNEMKVNSAFLTPTFSRLINPGKVPELKTLALIGEKPTQEDFNRWVGKLRLFNAYGPTECCVICVLHEIVDTNAKASIIGRGMIGAFVVVDDTNQPAPIATVGELYIGGPNLARGYFKDDQKTMAAFVDSPSWSPGSGVNCNRFYKTGDLVKLGLDGNIDYVGRKDTQVKLRGQRIELGEIEHHLRSLENVLDVIVEVIVPANDNQTQVLAGFICFEDSSQTRGDLKGRDLVAKKPSWPTMIACLTDQLATSLPQYMIPSILIPLKAMPLMPSGKADRRELRSLVVDLSMEELIAYSHEQQEKSGPATHMENAICQLWAKTLSIPQETVGTGDNFLRLGGDSILAMKMVATARNENIQLTVANVFQNPKLSDLALVATYITDVKDAQQDKLFPFDMVSGPAMAPSIRQDAASQCNLSPDSIEDVYPCTPFQEGLVTLSIRQAGAYVAQHIFELSANIRLGLGKFCSTWEAVLKSTPILRTRIIQTESGSLMQVVIKETIDWVLADDLNAYVKKTKEAPVELGTPLTRFALVTSTEEESDRCYFVWTTHHAIYDGWSLALILSHLNQVWDLSTKTDSDIFGMHHRNGLLIPFSNFVKNLQSLDRNAAETFWAARLSNGEPATFPLFQSTHLSCPSASLQCEIKFTRRLHSDLTSSTIIRVAWAILIGLYANSTDVIFGETLSGRSGSTPNLDRIAGPTVTTVPVRISLDPSKSVLDGLQEAQAQTLSAIPFEHLGLSNIRRINEKARSTCNFQNLLIIQPNEYSKVDETFMGPWQKNPINIQQPFDTYALTMECKLNSTGLTAKAIFDPTVMDAIQAERMMFQFRHLLQQLCLEEAKDIKLQDLQTMCPEDLQQLDTWNRVVPNMERSCVHHLINQVVQAQPSAPAICSWDGSWSYEDLNNVSSRLAHNLAGLGVHAEKKVPIFFGKSIWAIAAMIGIIKAGGAFVPLDPSHSETRTKSIVDQIDCHILLCSAEYTDMCLKVFPEIQVVTVSASTINQLPRDKKLHSLNIGPHNALYIIFTSGTSGAPKGVVLEHGAYCSSARDHAKALHFDRFTRHLQFAAYSFDTGVEDILTTLMVGGCICIPSEDERNHDLAGAISRMDVNTADLTPSFISQITPEDCPNLKRLILGGERLTSDSLKTWANRLHLINGYGTTECCVTSLVNSNLNPETDPANIGRAVGVVCWIVEITNPSRLAPIGCVGELLIEGPTLARGYLNDKVKTQAAFLENIQWVGDEGKLRRPLRLYTTGDLARYNVDGTLSYVGRKDSQVKIHGQRVELEEVEHRLVNHPRVRHAMAAVPNSGPYEHCLVAVVQLQSSTYVSQPNETESNPDYIKEVGQSEGKLLEAMKSDLSTFMSDELPGYMIPTAWIAIERMPLHSSRKLDRSRVNTWLADLPVEHRNGTGLRMHEYSPLGAEESIAINISNKIADLVSNGSPSIHATIAGYDVKLSAIGIDSIKIMTLGAFVKRIYGTSVRVQDLIGNRVTVRDIAQHVLDASNGVYNEPTSRFNLLKEIARLDARLTTARPIKTPLKTVFLTGATGFLGTQILRQLVTQLDVGKVITHVRARDVEHGRQRIIASAKSATWWSESFSSKLEIWNGDLAQRNIGLRPKQWQQLSNVDAIIHNGASVRWNADYYALEAANVLSTLELLITVTESSRRPKFIYVSGGRDFGDELSESEIAIKLAPLDGYSQSKFVSELLVKRFAQRHACCGHGPSIIKPGLIIGTATEGIANIDDFLWRFVAASVRIKAYSQPNKDAWLWVAGADRVAESVVSELLNSKQDASDVTVSVSDGATMQEFWDILNERTGYNLRPLPSPEYMNLLHQDVAAQEEAHPLWPVMHLLRSEGNLESKKPSAHAISAEASRRAKATIAKNIEFLAGIGFLLNPTDVSKGASPAVSQGFNRSFTAK